MIEARRFLLRFLVAIVLLYVIMAIPPVNDHVIVPYTAALARVTEATCHAIGLPAKSQKTFLFNGTGFAMNVENGCNGIEAVVLLVAAIVAFPATARDRARGLAFGFLLIQALNVLRLVMLYWLGAYHRTWFDLFHVTVWQTIVILITFGFFLMWSSGLAYRTAAPTPG
jgi:exosortase H (IPTLxxWG-CTERM-specific)